MDEVKGEEIKVTNGFIISSTEVESIKKFEEYISNPIGEKIFIIIWGEDQKSKLTVKFADKFAAPGAINSVGIIFKVIYIPKLDGLKKTLNDLFDSAPQNVKRSPQFSDYRAMNYSQSGKQILNLLLADDDVDPVAVRDLFNDVTES